MTAYYNEIDPFAAQWLRNLIDAGHIAPGVVDTRSIEEVTANDLKGFTQCHFFAGIGVWSYALRRAGWPDDRPVWTGSCPCQPFSVCGSKKGKSDKRHLFPAWFRLISECQPNAIFGEQVASKDGLDWLDDVQAKLENAAYAFAGFDLCAAGFGAPHIRQRLFWVADADSQFMETPIECGEAGRIEFANGSCISRVADTNSHGREGRLSGWQNSKRETVNGSVGCDSTTSGLAYTDNDRQQSGCRDGGGGKPPIEGNNSGRCGTDGLTNAVGGFWAGSDWVFCRDGKWRPVKPGLKPLVDGVAGRVGQLRAYGNAIVAPVAEAFIAAYLDSAR
ncbi:DNA cytosine methyltransferase [Citrobacter freundii]|uniref:DNA cytosine methyltransferase n=1 Tax=Citrobacter freundii TaxID=546 RepID=UPI0024A657A9|nr:DNA cytosine methyltransferase [Citrobacter freundii]WHE73226.1 DNA cytosine methyltransferase [Citrobacter freundii]WHE78118.1 DNA cytosine methyltransferase [Citrobacter freundii]